MAFDEVFEALKKVLAENTPGMIVTTDTPRDYLVEAPRRLDPKKPPSSFFGAVRNGKSYVSYHLFAIYAQPALLATISPALRKRMQGKSCFNFTRIDDAQVAELADLTRRGVAWYREKGVV